MKNYICLGVGKKLLYLIQKDGCIIDVCETPEETARTAQAHEACAIIVCEIQEAFIREDLEGTDAISTFCSFDPNSKNNSH